MENSIRRRAITRKAPTPQATDRISVILGTAGHLARQHLEIRL